MCENYFLISKLKNGGQRMVQFPAGVDGTQALQVAAAGGGQPQAMPQAYSAAGAASQSYPYLATAQNPYGGAVAYAPGSAAPMMQPAQSQQTPSTSTASYQPVMQSVGSNAASSNSTATQRYAQYSK